MERRLEFHEILEGVLGSKNVYFQPPEGLQIKYPCIIYSRSRSHLKKANNELYGHTKRYTVTVITRDPDDNTSDKLLLLPLSSFDRHYTSQNLHHYVTNIYY